MHKIMSLARRTAAFSSLAVIISAFQPGVSRAQNVLMQHVGNNRDGTNSSETILTPSNVTQFGMLFKLPVDDQVFAQPLVDQSVSIDGGTHAVVYVATSNNSVYAFDANTGTSYWHVNLGTAFTISDGGFTCQDTLQNSNAPRAPAECSSD